MVYAVGVFEVILRKGSERIAEGKFENMIKLGARCASAIKEWLHERPSKKFHNTDLMRLAFLDVMDDMHSRQLVDVTPYQIKRITYASGRRHGWKKSCFYESEHARGCVADFWEVQFHSIDFSRVTLADLDERCPGSPILYEIEDER